MNLNQPTYDFIGLADIACGVGLMVDVRDKVVFGRQPNPVPAGDAVT